MRNIRNIIAIPLVAFGLAGCVQPGIAPVPQATAPAPVATPQQPYRPLPAPIPEDMLKTPTETAAPAPAGPTGPLDARTGLHQAALVSVSGSADSQFIVLFRPGRTSGSNISGAPARLCGSAGVSSSRTNSPGSGSAMPGVQTMIVKCGTA